mmetsp:Transcript_2070/g.5267  ORF Transcript_2070/g.5267 Transcript_2070/m.5267 type:complete len:301 (-) Transcript_2070:610-1512(-)|eukprot:CAMPEP_0202865528 /NCGR_PEP_ID=MMETSP1391-20130828/6213_1 /ASSEMBLY_ACC=CAM_ASM_000867 /TAXON_ID=1034604 /ORGANISM="Chlamydomonas leiostraca, Strain SAG 11-49" /LENGTH=300 /DNA_ID=CAMNT_0049545387 /DNA_START=46 /DNA_END=948 /DNA_ORIENTATION=-
MEASRHIALIFLLAVFAGSRQVLARPISRQLTAEGNSTSNSTSNWAVDVAHQAWKTWNDTIQTGNPDRVLALYSPKAVLLATLSNTPRATPDAIRAYFVDFLKKKPSAVINEQHPRAVSDSVVINSGVYTFTFGADNSTASARFTYEYTKADNGSWLIVYHHSSLLPEPIGVVSQLEGEITAAFKAWNAALKTGDPEQVADCYTEDAVLAPTVSNWVRTTRAARIDYFTDFLKKGPQGTVNVGYVHDLGDGLAAYTGIYTFTFKEGPSVAARFSYTFHKSAEGKWLIVDHHSSALPMPSF